MTITPEQHQHLARIAAQHRLRMVVAFGSAVTGKVHATSDLDLAVLPEESADLALQDLAALLDALDRAFAPLKVDLVVLPRADPLLLKKIFETGVLLHGDERDFRWYRVYAHRRFSEYQPYFRLEAQATRALVRRMRHAR
ncbi:MAG: nucleotidyltransferase domain-containing protein [Armatimonadota bacterium]|nr:nucleotidyltransferase domain-containing protein [Armatimonadota bacterium]